MIKIISPTEVLLEGYEGEKYTKLKEFLTFTDQKAIYATKKFKNAKWFVNKFGTEAYAERLAELKEAQKRCILIEDARGLLTYSGLADKLAKEFNDTVIDCNVRPEPKYIPWDRPFDKELRYYQTDAINKLLAAKHAAVSLPTGSGKTAIILYLVKQMGLKTVIMAPSISIAKQLHELVRYHLGSKYVSMYGAGKGGANFKPKLITVGIAASLYRLKPGSKSFNALSDTEVFIVDESHLCPAATLEKVCLDLFKNASYRFFLSATQMRNDGLDLLLDGIIGKIVLDLPSTKLIEEGFLAKPNFIIAPSTSYSDKATNDPLAMLSYHLYNNRYVHQQAADFANKSVELLGHQVLIMIDRVEQFQYLINHLKFPAKFAHGGLNKDNKGTVPLSFHDSDVEKLVDDFNSNKYPILIGTQCISLGTDIRPVKTIINLQGGKSEIKFTQLIGRGTRLVEGKTSFNFIDFDISNVPIMSKFLSERIRIYSHFGGTLKHL